MSQTKQIRKNNEFFEKIENADPNENNELILKNTYTTLIGLLNQIEKQIGKVPVYEKSKSMSTSFRRRNQSIDPDEVDTENEGIKSFEKGLINPFGMIIELNNELLKNYFDLEEFKERIVQTPVNQRKLIILDFSGLKKLSSMEIGQLINLNEILKGEGTFAIAMHLTEPVEILLHMMGVESMFLIVKDFNDLIERIIGNSDFVHLDEVAEKKTIDIDREDTTRLIVEIKEKFNKVRGIQKPAVEYQKPPKLTKRNVMIMSMFIVLFGVLGYIWAVFFISISNPGVPSAETIESHQKELENELEKTNQ